MERGPAAQALIDVAISLKVENASLKELVGELGKEMDSMLEEIAYQQIAGLLSEEKEDHLESLIAKAKEVTG